MKKAIAELGRTSCLVITEHESGRQVGVILPERNSEDRVHEEDITYRVETAIKEFECAKSAKLIDDVNTGEGFKDITFECNTKTGDGEDEIRSYTITPSTTYQDVRDYYSPPQS